MSALDKIEENIDAAVQDGRDSNQYREALESVRWDAVDMLETLREVEGVVSLARAPGRHRITILQALEAALAKLGGDS